MSGDQAATIAVAAHDRPAALARLLDSIDRADIAANTDIVISIDGGGRNQREVHRVAAEWAASRRAVEVIDHPHLGLVDHFYACGDLTETLGPIVFLEDDLVVGPGFQRWATAALHHCHDDDRVAGVGLSAPWFDGYRRLPFHPVLDGTAAWFAQVPWYDGMAWTPDMWRRFRQWDRAACSVELHPAFDTLDPDEWFPDAVRYLVATDRYYMLPRAAHATNAGDAGSHFAQRSDFFQVPLELGTPTIAPLPTLDDSLAVYDDYMELAPAALGRLCPTLAGLDVTADLAGLREPGTVDTDWMLTTRPVRRAEQSWEGSMVPLVMNVVFDRPGDAIALARPADVVTGRAADLAASSVSTSHAHRGQPPGLRSVAERLAGRLAERWLDVRR